MGEATQWGCIDHMAQSSHYYISVKNLPLLFSPSHLSVCSMLFNASHLCSVYAFPSHTCCAAITTACSVDKVNDTVTTVLKELSLCFSLSSSSCITVTVFSCLPRCPLAFSLTYSLTRTHSHLITCSQVCLSSTSQVQIEVMAPGNCSNCHLAFW